MDDRALVVGAGIGGSLDRDRGCEAVGQVPQPALTPEAP